VLNIWPILHSFTLCFGYKKTSQSLLCREIFAFGSEIHMKDSDTLCGQNVDFWDTKHEGT
jgi:hypothetical protein